MNTKELMFGGFENNGNIKISFEWLKGEILKLNNFASIPFKILEFKEVKVTNGYQYFIVVEEEAAELSKQEWELLKHAWFAGWNAGYAPLRFDKIQK